MKRYLADEAATTALAGALAAALPVPASGWTILLQGELGAGKSTLARALLRALGHDGPVPSPTYTLVEPYRVAGTTVYHVDLYRIGSADELYYIGWDDLDDGLRLVEWPDRAPGLADSADLRIRLAYEGAGRSAVLEGLSERGHALARAVGEAAGMTDRIN